MRSVYSWMVALGVAAASLTSCSKSTYSFNSAPAYLGSQPVAVAKVKAVAPAATVATPVAEATKPEPVVAATKPAPVAEAPAKATPAPATAAKAAPAAEAATVANVVPAAKAAKPSLVQRLVLNKVAKQIAKIKEQKQATAGTDKVQSLKKIGLFLALGGLLAIIIGFVIAGGSVAGGSGAGFVIGVILAYLGYIALVVGAILAIVGLIADK